MLPKDSLEFLASKFGPPPGARIVSAPAEPKDRYYVQEADGTLTLKQAYPPPVSHCAGSLETLVEWAKAQDAPIIWHSRKEVVATNYPGNPAADACKMPLSASPQFAFLSSIAGESGGRSFDQASLIRALRTSLYGSFPIELLANVRKINLQKGKTVAAEQQRGKVSLNRSDIAEMSGANDLPEVIQFDVPVFSAGTIQARAIVRCDLDLNAETERFVITVLPGEIERAWSDGEDWIRGTVEELLGKDGCASIPLYLGNP